MDEGDDPRKLLAANLKAARTAAGFTQDQVADRYSLNKATVSAWETARGVPDALRLRDLCKLYNISADALLGLKEVWSARMVEAPPIGSRSSATSIATPTVHEADAIYQVALEKSRPKPGRKRAA